MSRFSIKDKTRRQTSVYSSSSRKREKPETEPAVKENAEQKLVPEVAVSVSRTSLLLYTFV